MIFDVGLHKGEDSLFYLRKGFRVVGIDANPDMCAETSKALAQYVESGDLIVLNRAIAEEPGEIIFYKNAETTWGTANPLWVERNARLGFPVTDCIKVEAVTLASLIAGHGVPHYVKIDIEGLDLAALQSLRDSKARPKYVSIESEKVSFAELRHEFAVFEELGYDRFKIVPQHEVERQRPPRPPLEGDYADHSFKWGSSGLFGEEAPGEWLTADQAIERYKRIFIRHQLWGDDPLLPSRVMRAILRRLFGPAGWYDTHARLAGSA